MCAVLLALALWRASSFALCYWCDAWRFINVRDSVVFILMVVFLIDLSGSALLRPLLWWHRGLFFSWTTVGANVGGCPKIRKGSPNTEVKELRIHERSRLELNSRRRRQGISKRLLSPQKLWIPLHVPSRPLL
jgi:hypothetical protein